MPVMSCKITSLAENRVRETAVVDDSDFSGLYETAFPTVAAFVSRNGGLLEDAKDIFQDAVIVYYEKSREPGFGITNTEAAYLLGIAKHLWIRKYNREKLTVHLDSWEATLSIPEDFYTEVVDDKLLTVLGRTGKKCMDLLLAFYYEKLSMDGIRNRFGYGSERSATVQKFKCLEKVRNEVKDKSLRYEDFTE